MGYRTDVIGPQSLLNWKTITLDDLVTNVSALSDVEDGVIALLTDISTRCGWPIGEAGLSDAIDAQKAKLAVAVAASTPAA